MTIRHRVEKLEAVARGGFRVILRRNLRKELKARPRKKGELIIVLPIHAEKL